MKKAIWISKMVLVTVFILAVGITNVSELVAKEKMVYSYQDITNHWAASFIQKWSDKGIVKGYNDGTFRPNHPITRAELIYYINNLLGENVLVLESSPMHISSQTDEAVTREEAIALINEALDLETQKNAWTTFTDMNQISSSVLDEVNTFYEKGLIEGYIDGTFRPSQYMTRAEVVKIIDKASLMGYVADIKDDFITNPNITLLKEVMPSGEKVYAVAIKYATAIDGAQLKPSDFSVEAVLGEKVGLRTIAKVYTTDSLSTAKKSKIGQYVILELDIKDSNASTMYYEVSTGKNILYQLVYYVTQNVDIEGVTGTKFESGTKQKNGSTINPLVDKFKINTFTGNRAASNKLDYALYEPTIENGKNYPLVVVLHGNGARGANGVNQLLVNQAATVWASEEQQERRPAYVLAPQNPLILSGLWLEENTYETTLELIQYITKNLPIDSNRIYITGNSMGGFGTWGFIQRNPEMFAAAMPVCGGGDLTKIEEIKELPIWAFHATDDHVVKVSGEIDVYLPEFMINGSRDMVNALKGIGSTKIKYTEYEAGIVAPNPHASWIHAYSTQEAIDWMFEQSK